MAAGTTEVLINQEGAIVIVVRNWLASAYAQSLHDRLVGDAPWIAEKMTLYGKTFDIPRTMFFLGDDHVTTYSYSRLKFPVQKWIGGVPLYGEIETIRNQIKTDPILQHVAGTPLHYDSCLLNHYRDGTDTIAPHSDKEALGPANAVVTISLGATRKFEFKHKTKGPNGRYPTIKTVLNNGDLVLMVGTCQEHWTHSIPREPSVSASRISLTYRLISTTPTPHPLPPTSIPYPAPIPVPHSLPPTSIPHPVPIPAPTIPIPRLSIPSRFN